MSPVVYSLIALYCTVLSRTSSPRPSNVIVRSAEMLRRKARMLAIEIKCASLERAAMEACSTYSCEPQRS